MKLDNRQGLSNNQVTCFLKDSRGLMWFGTISGLNRYDGYSIKSFRNDIRDSATLLNNNIINLFEDPAGKIWVTTIEGTNIYDPRTEKFIRNTAPYASYFGLPDGSVTNIIKDSQGSFWFIHETKGIYIYRASSDKKIIHLSYPPGTDKAGGSNQIASLAEDKSGNMWIIHKNGVLDKMNIGSYKILFRTSYLKNLNKGESLLYNITIDTDGDPWLYVLRANLGVFYFNNHSKNFLNITKNSFSVKLTSNIIQGIVQDNQGLIWIGTDHGGIDLINKKTWETTYLLHDEDNDKSLSQNTINSLYKDSCGIIWTGTYKDGINYYHENIFRFALYQNDRSKPQSLPYNDFNRFAEDDQGNLWLGGNGGGLIYFERKKNTYTRYLHQPDNPASLASNVVVSLFIDSSKRLWIGTYYGGLSYFDGKTFTTYRHDASDKNSIADDSVWEIFEDSRKNLWIGTLDGGLDQLDRTTGKFTHFPSGGANSIHAGYVSEITEDNEGNIWVGTSYGLEKYSYKTNSFIHFLSNAEKPGFLSNNLIHTIYEDKRGNLWIGTHEGLNLYDKQSQTFRSFGKEDGMSHNTILSVTEDKQGNLWFGTPEGITRAEIEWQGKDLIPHFVRYDETDGLQGKEFNENAALQTKDGELIFGGSKGFNLFRPQDIRTDSSFPKIFLSDLYLFNKRVNIGNSSDNRTILPVTLNEVKEITLKHSENVITIEFSALNFLHPEKNQYLYQLEGFDKGWISGFDNSRKATYTNLDPGVYLFKVKSTNSEGVWGKEGVRLKITILPPLWLTKTAIAFYLLLTIFILYLARKAIQRREQNKFKIQKEREEAQRMHELDQMKINFFTNVSHEFRTPLTLILAPLEKILKPSSKVPRLIQQDKNHEGQLQLIHRNAKRLLNLVNQLLDLGKLEFQEIKFNPAEGDIIRFIRDTTFSFSDLSEKQHITLSFDSDIISLRTAFDEDKLEKILFNLLSNAFKFTPDGGNVNVTVQPKSTDADQFLEIKVKDSGIGIPLEKQEKIFERFYQHDVPASMMNQGSGIGLSITREFVKIHGGTIQVVNESETGSCFSVVIPVQEIVNETADDSDKTELLSFSLNKTSDEPEQISEKPEESATILLVEDNFEFRQYLKEILADQYTILEAGDGKNGLEKAINEMPDLIVSDVMMPEMNGIDMCKRLKDNAQTSHIPVILLTARNSDEQKLEGYETGAQDYIEKPFNFELLQSKIKSLLKQQSAARKAYRQQITIKGKDVAISSLDEKLVQKAIAIVEKNISNPDFSVEAFSSELGMSRIHLYRKLQSLTGKSPIDFIRSIRLERSRQLLGQSQLTVAEIAYQVGFNNPKYFAKHFREEFSELPSSYAMRARINKGSAA
ncbi:hybrid sensor histidine kinase/response regulator transcription factor [Dyadobacter psychrotolerans]|nr:two-component regulator propeller domain-containing protein [Dyadobacter psychrotolerans]